MKLESLFQLGCGICFSIFSQLAISGDITLLNGEPFPLGATASNLGTAIAAPGYDLHPTVMYENSLPADDAKKFKMWWFCQFRHGVWGASMDKAPTDLHQHDRICYSSSRDGTIWSEPKVVLKALGGSAGANRGDDHMVGAPSVIKVNCTSGQVVCPTGAYTWLYVMFYEAYGNWMTKINRFWSVQQLPSGAWGDSLVTNGIADGRVPGSVHESWLNLGYAPFLKRYNTQPIYLCKIVYPDSKENRYLSKAVCSEGPCSGGTCSALKKEVQYLSGMQQIPVFWTWKSAGTSGERRLLYRCYDTAMRNTFASQDPNCEGRLREVGDLGYVSAGWNNGVPTSDMKGALENGVFMAYSPDGENWTRFDGGGTDMPGAVVPAADPRTAYDRILAGLPTCPGEGAYEIHQTYGAGYPAALIRKDPSSGVDYVQVYYKDYSDPTIDGDKIDCISSFPTAEQRVQIPLSNLFSATAWKSAVAWAKRDKKVQQGSDIKWSPVLGRYFALHLKYRPANPRYTDTPPVIPLLLWSAENPNMTGPLSIPDTMSENSFDIVFDSAQNVNTWRNLMPNRLAQYGGILGDENGNLVCFNNTSPRYCAIHLFTEGQDPTKPNDIWYKDLDHLLIFGYY